MASPRTFALTGGTGSIGSRFLADAVSSGYSVRALSRAPSHLPVLGVDWHQFDLSKSDELGADALQDVEQVVHLAAYIPRDHNDPDEGLRCWQANVAGTHRLIEAMGKAGVKRLIQTGSANVYAPWLTYPDETSCIHPQTRVFYLASKAAQEYCAESACRKHNIDLVTLRLSSVFGTGGGTVDNIARKLLDGTVVELTNEGLFGADFVSCDDVLAALFLVLDNDCAGTFNVASGERSTIAEVAQILVDATGQTDEILHFMPQEAQGDSGFPAINIAKLRALGYRPKALRESLSVLVERLSDIKRDVKGRT
ncbi:MAG: NAD(P)-dependent oxidoreductase [Sphingorhabdus sp.]